MTDNVGDEAIMYEPLLDDTDVETLMDEDDFEIDTRSRGVRRNIKGRFPKVESTD